MQKALYINNVNEIESHSFYNNTFTTAGFIKKMYDFYYLLWKMNKEF